MATFARSMKTQAKRALHGVFALGQKLGVDILPRHFYSQVPDLARMRGSKAWRAPMSMAGVKGAELKGQLKFLDETVPARISEALNDRPVHGEAILTNRSDGGYGPIEAEFLYAFIRTWKPKKVIQVGCGVSTAIIQQAAEDEAIDVEIVCLDPYPTPFLTEQSQAGKITLIAEPAENVDMSVFEGLGAGDLMFVDSTHAVRAGSEVNRVVLEVLPRLAKGVFVHFHDIYFPYDYPRRLLSEDLFFHSESTLVHAFLACNARYRIEAALSTLHYAAPQALKDKFARYDPQGNEDGLAAGGGSHFPSSLWLRVVA